MKQLITAPKKCTMHHVCGTSHDRSFTFTSPNLHVTNYELYSTQTHTYICIYIYMYMYTYMCVCVCVCIERERERERRNLFFSEPDLDRSPFSSAYLSGRKRESDANNFLGAVSKLFILCAKYVNWNLSFSGTSATLQT